MTTEQLKIWESDFGNDWLDRNQIDPMSRVVAFRTMIDKLPIKSILEIGCAQGHNLISLSKIGSSYKLCGIEPNSRAVGLARKQGLDVRCGDCFKIPFDSNSFDLVFTVGVLMHVAIQDLTKALTEICRVSRAYVLVVEYFSVTDENPIYRGYDRLLYKRNYGVLMKAHGLANVGQGYWGKGSGIADCNWWMFKLPVPELSSKLEPT